jgi:PAS domain-containing protein
LVELLLAQNAILRQRGMSVSSAALSGLKETQTELKNLTDQIASDSVELEQLRALAEITALVNSSLDIDQVLNEVMDRVIQITGAERGYIVLRNDSTGDMEFRIARNIDRRTLAKAGSSSAARLSSGTDRPAGSDHQRPIRSALRGRGKRDDLYPALDSVRPLIVKDEIIGVVYADNRIRDALYGEKELSLLVAFANQAAIAIENARLFDNVQRALTEITEMKKLLDNVFASIASGVITTDVKDIVTTYNLAAERILDIHSHIVLGHSLTDALPMIYSYVKDLLDLVYQQSYQEIVEIDPVLPQRGQTNLTLKLTPLKNDQETEGVAIVVDDLTEIKKRDATLEVVRRYLPPAMVDNIQNLDGLGLGGERRVITVLFVETRPFHMFPPDLLPTSDGTA